MMAQKRMIAEVIDERVTEEFVTEYLLRPVGVGGYCGVWVPAGAISPLDLDSTSRRALFGGDDAERYGFDQDGNPL